MIRRFRILAVAVPLLAAPVLAHRADAPASDPALRSVHLLDLPADLTEEQLVAVIRPVNEAIAALGYPDAGYRLWKARSENAAHRYLWEGIWPDAEAYEAIHAAPEYVEATRAGRALMPRLEEKHVYIRFAEVPGTGFGGAARVDD